jgi:hypothetical protein
MPQSVSEAREQSAMPCRAIQDGNPDDATPGASVQLMMLVPICQIPHQATAAGSSTSAQSTSSISIKGLEDAVVDVLQVNDPSSITYYSIDRVALDGLCTRKPAAEQQGASSSSSSGITRNPAMLGVTIQGYPLTMEYIGRLHEKKKELELDAIRADLNLSMAHGDLRRSYLRLAELERMKAEQEAELERMKAALEQFR